MSRHRFGLAPLAGAVLLLAGHAGADPLPTVAEAVGQAVAEQAAVYTDPGEPIEARTYDLLNESLQVGPVGPFRLGLVWLRLYCPSGDGIGVAYVQHVATPQGSRWLPICFQ